jgi:exosortase A-associated hydrolase 2
VSSAFFLPVEPGYRFCIWHPPAGTRTRSAIIHVPAFGEEMNKARRMAALQSRRLAAAGHAVLQMDLLGCGDSSGELRDARWHIWRRDIVAAIGWLKSRMAGPVILWGLRLGATLAADVARDPGLGVEQLILWQPVASGEQFLVQFLRLRLAAEMLAEGNAQSGVRALREALARGATLEIGGYDLHPELAAELEALRLAELTPAVRRVHWLEVLAHGAPELGPASRRTVAAWQAKGLAVRAAAVGGEPFWSTLEITECAALLEATEEGLR